MSANAIDYTDLLGLPFAYGGRGPDVYDCYGLAIELHRRAGFALPDYGSSPEAGMQETLFTLGTTGGDFRKVPDPRPLDIVVFRMPGGRWHCGCIVDGYRRFAHIMERCSVVVEEMDSPAWRHRVQGVYRWS